MFTSASADSPTGTLQTALKALISSIEAHSGFSEQESCRSGKLFFVWDFVSNTLRMLDNLPITPDRFEAEKREIRSDVMNRCMFAHILITNTTGKLEAMCGGDRTQFGEDVVAKSNDCQTKAMMWGTAEGLLSG